MTSVNSCPICGMEMYSFDRMMEIGEEHRNDPPATELTDAHIRSAALRIQHTGHAHLITETKPGVYEVAR